MVQVEGASKELKTKAKAIGMAIQQVDERLPRGMRGPAKQDLCKLLRMGKGNADID